MNPRTDQQKTEQMRNLLAFLLVGAFVSSIPLFVFKTIPSANEQIITYMAGQLSGMATLALGFYFVNKAGQDAIDAKREETAQTAVQASREAVRAVHAANTGAGQQEAGEAASQVADAAADEAAKIKGET